MTTLRLFLLVFLGLGCLVARLHAEPPDESPVLGNLAKNARSPSTTDRLVSRIQLKRPGESVQWLEGWVMADGMEGGCMLVEADGRLHVIYPQEMLQREVTEQTFAAASIEDVQTRWLAELPKGFKATSTKHYLVAYNTTEAYAKWNAALYERLYRGFYNYWKGKGIELAEPEFPLMAIVFEKRNGYLLYAEADDVKNADSMIGYYNQMSNRIAGYDLTGIDGLVPEGQRVTTSDLVNKILQHPNAERSVATVVHEAVHQLAYNSGLQTRMADNPVAISEGIAMFFESPDLRSATGWNGIGKLNEYNAVQFRNAMKARRLVPIARLIQDDGCFRDSGLVSMAYSESWALCYFLMKARSKEFSGYLKEIALRPPLEAPDAKRRLTDFKKYFGEDLDRLDRDFLKYMTTTRF